MAFSVLTHNVCGSLGTGQLGQRVAAMCREYERLGPDVLALQEVYRPGLLRQLRDQLPSMPYARWAPGRRGPMAGLVVFSKQPIKTTGSLLFSSKLRHWGWGFRKGALAWETGDMQGVNFHLGFNPFARWETPNLLAMAQAWQVAKLVSFVNAMGPGPKVVAGDANIHYGTLLYQLMVAGAGLSDPFAGRWPTISNNSGSRAYAMDCVFTKELGSHTATVARVFEGQTGFPPSWRRETVSDHEGLLLQLTPG